MTVGAITFDLGFGASPFLVTLDDASGLAPLTLPEALAAQTAPRDESIPTAPTAAPAADAVQRFTAAMAGSAQPVPAEHPLRMFQSAVAEKPVATGATVPTEVPAPAVAEKPVAAVATVPSEVPVPAPAAAERQVVSATPAAVKEQVAEPVAASGVAEIPVVAETTVIAETPIAADNPAVTVKSTGAETPIPVGNPVVADTSQTVEFPDVVELPSIPGQREPSSELPVAGQFANEARVPREVGEASADRLAQAALGGLGRIDEGGNSAIDSEDIVAATQSAPVVAVPAADVVSVPVAPEVAAAAAATARTEVIVETVDMIVEAVAEQIEVTSALSHGDGNVRIVLKPTVLDGSEISVTARSGELSVAISPATPDAARLAAAALPRLETALAEHVSAFHHVAVAVVQKKGKANETA